MISADEALRTVLDNVSPLGVEQVSIREVLGRVLADKIQSPRDIPSFDNSAMDGYAVQAKDVAAASESNPVSLEVIGTIAAGSEPERPVMPGTASRIMTGAPIPAGADTIVPVEYTTQAGGSVAIGRSSPAGAFIRPRGEDLRRGEEVMRPGKLLSASDIGMLASLNRTMVQVFRRPRIAIVGTGNELVNADQVPVGSQVVNSSAYALAAAVAEAGGEPAMLKVARDRQDEIRERLSEALAFDMALSTGGVSAGEFDYVKLLLEDLGVQKLFHGVAQRPGRPLVFGLADRRPFFGLPGNPVSTLVCFYLYARPALRKMGGHSHLSLPHIKATAAVDINLAPNLTEFIRVRLERRGAEVVASPTGNQGSGILSSFSRADGLLVGPAAMRKIEAGSQATVLVLDPASVAAADPGFE